MVCETVQWVLSGGTLKKPLAYASEKTARRQAEAIERSSKQPVLVEKRVLKGGEWVPSKE